MVIDAGRFVGCLRLLDQNRNGNRGAGAQTEDIAGLFAADFTACAAVAAQIEDIDGRKFACEAFAHTGLCIAVEPVTVGDKADDAALLFVEPVRSPAEGLDIAVVKRVLVVCVGFGRIGTFNLAVERRVFLVLRIVVGRLLAHGIRRIADDDGDAPFLLLDDAPRVGRELLGIEVLVRSLLAQLEGVGQADAAEGTVLRIRAHQVVEDILDVDRGDVVGHQHDFVGMDFPTVFALQRFARDEPALEQARDEGACSGEGVEDVDVLVGERPSEFPLEDVTHRTDDEVDHLDRRVDDAQFLDRAGRGHLEELVVQLDDDALPGIGLVDVADRGADIFVKLLEFLVLLLGLGLVVEQVEHLLHRARDGVAGGKLVVLEEGLEHRARDDVLREHLDGVLLRKSGVDVAVQTPHELVEGPAVLAVVGDEGLDALDVLFGNLGDVLGPELPVAFGADLGHQLGVEDVLQVVEAHRELGGELLGGTRGAGLAVAVAVLVFVLA